MQRCQSSSSPVEWRVLPSPRPADFSRHAHRSAFSWRLGTDDLVLDALQVLEEESIVMCRSIFRILPRLADDDGSDLFQLGMESIDLGARLRLERKMVERSWLPAMDGIAR